jgi:hypothetical protein
VFLLGEESFFTATPDSLGGLFQERMSGAGMVLRSGKKD